MSVIQSAISSIRNKASAMFNDDQGWFRGGQFTPVKQVQSIQQNARDNAPLTNFGPVVLPNFQNKQLTNTLANQQRMELPTWNNAPVIPKFIYNNLAKPVLESNINIPRNLSTGTARIVKEFQSGKPSLNNIVSGVLPLAEGAFDLSTMGLSSVGKNIAKQAAKDVIKQGAGRVIAKGAVTGVFLGGLGGASREIDTQYGKTADPSKVLQSGLVGSLIGGVLGGTVSAGSVAWEKGLENITRKIIGLKPKLKPAEARVEAEKYLRNKVGEFAGKNPDYKSPDGIKFYGDLNESLGLGRYDRIQPGLSTRSIGAEERALIKSKGVIPEVGGKGVKPILGQTENGTLFRGYGADRPKMIGSDLGSGRYFSESIDTAKSYGPKVESINTSGLKLKEMDIVDYKKLVSQRYHEVRNNHPLWDGSDTAATKIMDEAKDFVNQQLASQGYQGLKTKIGKETIYNIFSEDIVQLPKQAQEIGVKTTESSKLPLKTTQPSISPPSIPEVGGRGFTDSKKYFEILPNSYLKTPKKIYRGVSGSGEGIGAGGGGSAVEGYGLYTTTKSDVAKGYANFNGQKGTVIEMNPNTDIPQNPIYFRDSDAVRDWVFKVSKEMGINPKEFETKVGINKLVNDLGHDGIAFDMNGGVTYVKYPEVSVNKTLRAIPRNVQSPSIPEVKTKGGITDIPNRNSTLQGEISPPKVQTELPIPNKSSQSPLSLPQGEGSNLGLPQGQLPTTEVRTSKQMVNLLRDNPNARVTIKLPDGKTSIAYKEGTPIIIRTKGQLKTVLAEYPNANVRIELKPGKGQIATLGDVPDRADVAAVLPSRVDRFVQDVLGYSTKAPMSGTRQASGYTKLLRKGQEKITTAVEGGMASENSVIRTAATTLQNFFRGLGMSPERAVASSELRGGLSVANERAYDVMETLYKSLDHNKGSLERINAVLDPTLAKVKVSFADLTPKEQGVYKLVREGLDIIHDQSYANGHISPELYVKNKGKYVPRLYDVTELPPEVNKFITQSGKKIDNNLYKQRTEVDAWKIDNSLNDPVYALGKRLAQVQTNTAIKKYTDFLSGNPNLVSDVERAGFTKLSDSPAYGSLSGKYVLNSAAEDLKGFFFSNQTMQNVYDVFRAYDRMPIRQLQKKLLTVFNPTTNVGNIVSDQVFGFVSGVNPLTLNKNLLDLKSNPAKFKQFSDYLMSKGVTGTDITRSDFVTKLGKIDELASGKVPNILVRTADKVQSFYGGTDDIYKVSAFKALLDKGFTLEEATRKVADGFQNYANVGKYYDVWAKTPVLGSTFIKFQGDLLRIIKNGAVNNPLGLITFLGTLQGISLLSSKLSGETSDDYKTRTERFAVPMIPGLNIPLTWQTPIGEINVARYISPFYANNDTTNVAKMLPFVPNINPDKDVASNIAMNANDPFLAPLIQLGVNRDFRGKPISDPDENKYQPSTLTPSEKLKNRAMFAGRAYTPPPINSAIDVGSAIQGQPNMYGSPQTPLQAAARLGGVKITDMSPAEVQKIRERDAEFAQKGNEYIQQQVNSVTKQQLKGEITPEQAQARIANLQKGVKQVDVGLIKGSGDTISYINENGNLANLDLAKYDSIGSLPSDNKYNAAIKESKQYSTAATILDNTNLSAEQQQSALKRLGVDPAKADYYRIANDNNNLKTMFVLDAVNKVKTQGGGFADILQTLANQRTEINGQMIASNGVLDNLVDEGVLTKSQATQLKKYKMEGGKLVSTKKLSVKKPKKVTLKKMTVKKMPAIRLKRPKALKLLKVKRLKAIKLRRPSVAKRK